MLGVEKGSVKVKAKMVKEAVKDLLEVRISELTVSAVKINTAAYT